MRESGREIEMNDTKIDETNGTIVTDFVSDENNTEDKLWKFCNSVTVPRFEVFVMTQMVLILILLAFCIFKLSLTQLTCKKNLSLFLNIIGFSWLCITKSKSMNKVIDISTRLFLAIVGPSGSGKTELIFKLLKGKTFYPKFQRAIHFYKEIQPIYSEKSNTHSIDLLFIKLNGFDNLQNLENILLIFDDSCEEIYSDKSRKTPRTRCNICYT